MNLSTRYVVSLALLVVAAIAWFGERIVVRQRVAELAENRLTRLNVDLAALDAEVDTRNKNGDYFRFLGARPGKDTDASWLNSNADLVESAVLLDRNFATIAKSGRDLGADERSLVRQRLLRSILAEKALLRRYILTDFDGQGLAYLVLLVKPDLKNATSTLFAASFDFSVIASFSRDTFNEYEKKLVSVLLSRQNEKVNEFTIRGRSLASIRRVLITENLTFFQVAPLPAIYEYFSTYLFLLILFGSLVSIWRGYSAQRFTRRELSERTLHGLKSALGAREQAMVTMSQLATRDGAVREKLVAAVDKEAEIEERLAAARTETIPVQEPQPIIIDILPERRQFRFMNPARIVSAAGAAVSLSEGERKLRQRAFSTELKGLMEALAQPADAQSAQRSPSDLVTEIERFEAANRFPPIDQYLYYLNELYFDEVTHAELAEAMRVAGDAVQSQSFALLLYDAAGAYYKTSFVHSAPRSLEQTFYLLARDSVLPNDVPEYGYVPLTSQLKRNPYLKKRFPSDFAEQLKGLHIFNLNESFLRARIVFFDNSRGGEISDLAVLASVRAYLRQLAPAIHMYVEDHAPDAQSGDARNLAFWSVKELRESIRLLEGGETWISQYVFESGLALDTQLSLMSDISRMLEPGEKIIMLSPTRIAVVHRPGAGKLIEERLTLVGKKFIIKESEFGKSSRNLYTFAEF